jgi:hypothetical protein
MGSGLQFLYVALGEGTAREVLERRQEKILHQAPEEARPLRGLNAWQWHRSVLVGKFLECVSELAPSIKESDVPYAVGQTR